MTRRLVAVGLVALLFAAGVAFATGIGPAPGGRDGGEAGSFPTATATPSDATSSDAATAEGTARPAFAFRIERVAECGRTCRGVTTTLRNDGDARATDVVVHTRVFAGNGTDGDAVWSGTERVGTLAAGGSHTATRRVELSYSEGLAVRRADGWITIQTTVESDERTVTFTERRNVS